MKRLYFILIAIAFSLCIANPGCSDFAETDAVPPEGVEEGTVQSELLENGNELLTYPNGVRVERTPSGEILWQGDILCILQVSSKFLGQKRSSSKQRLIAIVSSTHDIISIREIFSGCFASI